MLAKILERVAVRTAARWASSSSIELQVGEQVDLGPNVKGEGGDWMVIRLSDNRVGYLPGNAKVFWMRDVTVAQPRLDVYQQPIMGSAVVMSCKSGDILTLTGVAGEGNNQWGEVITPTGEVGFIMPGMNIRNIIEGDNTRDNTTVDNKDDLRQAGKKNIAVGALWFVGGIIITGVGYSIASAGSGGGRYFITSGAFIFGGIQFVKGLWQYISSL